ncbi:kinesin-like protein KIN-10C [Corylus avellana]|uniref:kinesin-like protein KIN-10C n=1 Tax=Corylus avellana TaxID=13451 RepID=UPI00286BB872|nr:kinesin-like protein KIN-10C [Corylus avellana]
MASTPSKATACRKVRVVAKIRDFTGSETENSTDSPWISVNKPSGEASNSVTISFRDQPGSRKEYYDIDYCYEQNEDNDLIFSREIKPLILRVFEGCNPTIITCGAKGSGKTYVIQGSDEKPGLATLAMAEILSMAEKNGKSIAISFYEVYQEHVHDLLDPKQPEVLVLEDKGKIQYKGLSQVTIKSITEFHKLYLSWCDSRKSVQKMANELPHKSHKGLIVHVLSPSENGDTHLVGKMNFVDLAGYKDARRKSVDSLNLVESTKLNKSIYAVYNVVYSLNVNENHVPYRESKLTRMLKDSLSGMNRILMITCLNPSFCQDSVYMLSLASRSCQGINRVTDSTKKVKNSTRPLVPSSQKSRLPGSVFTTMKKHPASQLHFSENKASGMAFTMKGRKLFDEASHQTKSEKGKSISNNTNVTMLSEVATFSCADVVVTLKQQEEGKSISNHTNVMVLSEVENPLAVTLKDKEPTSIMEKNILIHSHEAFSFPNSSAMETTIPNKDVLASEIALHGGKHHDQVTSGVNSTNVSSFTGEGHSINKENQSIMVNKGVSPPISARLRELSNNLKSLCSSTPLHKKLPEAIDVSFYGQVSTDNILEPKTPTTEQSMRVYDRLEVANVSSPWETLSMRSSGMKNSLVQEYIKFLNTANKEDLKRLKGIGEKRATYILQLREESPEPFKSLDDLKEVGLSAKQIKGIMKKEAAELFNEPIYHKC